MSIQTSIGGEASPPAGGMVAPAASRLAKHAWQVVATILRQRAISRAESDLMALSDRTLKDIGLSRGEIRSAVRTARSTEQFAARVARPAGS